MIRKLRLRFIFAALLSILFVLASTIAAINAFNYVKMDGETNKTLNGIIDFFHQFLLRRDGAVMEEQEQQREEEQFPAPMPFFNQTFNEQFFVVAFDEEGSIYDHFENVAPNKDDDEFRLLMATKIYHTSKDSGDVESYRFQTRYIEDLDMMIRPSWGQQSQEPEYRDFKYTYIAFVDTSERMHGFNNYLTTSLVIATISYTFLAGLIIFSSKIIFKTTEESYKKQKAFITNASHELKTPLTIISTDLELVEMDHGKSEWTESIHDQILRLNDMTKQLVTLSRLDEGNASNYPFAEFSLSKLASESVDSFISTFKSKKLTFSSDIPSDVDMKGNRYLINELFYIFFDNALKYTKSNGEASLTIKKNQNKKIEITFSNDIEDNEMDTEQLFERFYRSPNSVSKEGSGIGLSIAKEIVELHKGRINVSVKNGKIYFIIQL